MYINTTNKENKNWSGRGTARMNQMETYQSAESKAFWDEKPIKRRIDTKQADKMITTLLTIKPDNAFYKDLLVQLVQKDTLSKKQLECINKDYSRLEKGHNKVNNGKQLNYSVGNLDKLVAHGRGMERYS